MSAIVNPNPSNLDSTQILQRAFDETADKLRVDATVSVETVNTEVSIEVDAASGDNIAISNEDGSQKVTVTSVGFKEALDVNITNPSITVSIPTISNISATVANSEYNYTITAGTKRIAIKSRTSSNIQLAYNSGQTNTNYLLIPNGSEYIEHNLALDSNLTVYFQTNKNNQIIEILTWS